MNKLSLEASLIVKAENPTVWRRLVSKTNQIVVSCLKQLKKSHQLISDRKSTIMQSFNKHDRIVLVIFVTASWTKAHLKNLITNY